MRIKRTLILSSFSLLLMIQSSGAASVVLRWTAPGDNNYVGQASVYDLRYSTSAITDANWAQATIVGGLPLPKPYGNREIFSVTGLTPGTTYYFAIKAADSKWNWSPLSDIAVKTTCAGCVGNTGNVDGSPDGLVDIRDLSLMEAFLLGTGTGIQLCFEEANVDASPDGFITISDLSYLVAYLTSGRPLPKCP